MHARKFAPGRVQASALVPPDGNDPGRACQQIDAAALYENEAAVGSYPLALR